MAQLTIKDIMTKEAVTVRAETSLIDVAKTMTEHKFNGLPVVDANGILIGIVTEYNFDQQSVRYPSADTAVGPRPIAGFQ